MSDAEKPLRTKTLPISSFLAVGGKQFTHPDGRVVDVLHIDAADADGGISQIHLSHDDALNAAMTIIGVLSAMGHPVAMEMAAMFDERWPRKQA